MKAVSGTKLKADQGPLAGALKELGYDETQVGYALRVTFRRSLTRCEQVFKF